jgi:hypothetical protein
MTTKTKKIYLAGPITGLTYKGAQDWRLTVKEELERDGGFRAYSPLRLKEFLDDDKVILGHENSRNWIVARDRWDVSTADIVLANLAGTTVASVGTVSEITQAADTPDTFCIVVLPEAEKETNPHHHIFMYHLADAMVNSLDEAIELIHSL